MELKIRAFVKSLNKVLDVVEIRFLANEIGVGTRHDWHYYDMKDCVLMHSINEVDKNGNEIFVGDILKNKENIGYVVYEKSTLRFGIESLGSFAVDYETKDYYINTEIVGNIYENPQLF